MANNSKTEDKDTLAKGIMIGAAVVGAEWWLLSGERSMTKYVKRCVAEETTYAVRNLPREFNQLDDDAVKRIIDRCKTAERNSL